MIVILILLILTGICAGLLAGLLGLGGGILFTPVILILFQWAEIPDPVLWTLATSLMCNFTSGLSSAIKHYQMDNFFLREGMMIGIFGIAGTVIGRFIATSPWYTEREFTIVFSLIMIYSIYHFLKKNTPSDVETGQVVRSVRWYHAVGIGLVSGTIATLAGVGGGLIMVPAMTILLVFSFRKVVSISSTAIVFITLSGWLQLAVLTTETSGISGFHLGYVDLGIALPLIISSFFGARYGVALLHIVRLRTLEIAFGILLIVVLGRLMYGLLQ